MDRSSFSFQRNGLLTPPSPFPCLYTPTLHLPHFPYLDNRPPLYNCPHNHTSRSCLNDWELEITHVVKLVSICANLSQHVQRKCSGYSCLTQKEQLSLPLFGPQAYGRLILNGH
ncbi:hypothetical protein BDR07DRAFT_1398770 [Suillus spraguei]|nr:hypothetical protein BDR07DRAFT_1398770 [Suillus spraguei]